MTLEEDKNNEAVGRVVTEFGPKAFGWAKRAFVPLLMGYAAGGGSGTAMANLHSKYVSPTQLDSTVRVAKDAILDTLRNWRMQDSRTSLADNPFGPYNPQNHAWRPRHADQYHPVAESGYHHGERQNEHFH